MDKQCIPCVNCDTLLDPFKNLKLDLAPRILNVPIEYIPALALAGYDISELAPLVPIACSQECIKSFLASDRFTQPINTGPRIRMTRSKKAPHYLRPARSSKKERDSMHNVYYPTK